MSHNLNFNEQTGKYSFFTVKEKAWHGLGQIIHDYPTSAEAIRYAGLDYLVEKRHLFTLDTENQNANTNSRIIVPEVSVPNYYATIRTDNDAVLGVVGKDYQVVQNIEAFAFFDSIVGQNGIKYETAGALGKGERIFITAKLPNYIRVGNRDLLEQYMFLTTSHDGFGSITAAFTPIRVVCNNTLNAAMRSKSNTIKIRHTDRAKERLEQAHYVMSMSDRISGEMANIFNNWTRVRIADKEVRRLIESAMAPNKEVPPNSNNDKRDLSVSINKMVDSVYEYAMTDPNQLLETTAGTLFGAYNAVAGYFQNVRTYKDQESKLKSLFLGGLAQQRVQTTFNLCTMFSELGDDALRLN